MPRFPGFSRETIAYANPATGYVISNDGSERQIDACVRFLKYMLSKDVQEQIVTKTHQAPSNPNISDTWIHEQVPVLADAVAGLQAGRPADPDALFRPARQIKRPAGTAAGRAAAGKGCAAVCCFHHSRFGAGARITVKISQLNQNITSIAAQNAAGLLKLHNRGGFFFRPRSKKHNLSAKCFMAFFFFRS